MKIQKTILRVLFLTTMTAVFCAANLLTVKTFAADGLLDSSFTTEVKLFSSAGDVYQLATDANGKIYVAGNFNSINGVATKSIVRLNTDSSLDTSFNPGNSSNTTTRAFALQSDGKVIFAASYNLQLAKIVRLNTDGSLDSTFNSDSLGTPPDSIYDIAIQPDGKILIAGTNASVQGVLRRLNTDGSTDATFNATTNAGIITALALQTDGKILIGGNFTTVGGQNRYTITRLNTDGSLDTNFNAGQVGTGIPGGAAANATDILVAPNGKIYFTQAGATSYNGVSINGRPIVRLNSDGTLDTAFTTPANSVGGQGYNRALALEADGKIFAVGSLFTTGFPSGVVKFNIDGSVDTSFAPTGTYAGNRLYSIAIQPDGKVVIGGNFTKFEDVNKFSISRLQNTVAATPVNNPALRIADFDGDGRSDISLFRSGTWFVNSSNSPSLSELNSAPTASYQIQWGLSTDKLAPADFDGDGKTDIAVWREGATSVFYILNSATNTVRVENFGITGDVPLVVGDWDGDGKADPAVYREAAVGAQSYFYYRGSLNNAAQNITFVPWGTTGDKAVRGDFDGDGRLDAAVFRPSTGTWYVRQSGTNAVQVQIWGLATDKRLTGDFDGDGKTDFGVFRNGVWIILNSSNGQVRFQNWGLGTDTIAAGDFDGDGKTDFGVWRGGVFYILNSTTAQITIQNFGVSGDVPIAAAYIQ